MRKSSGCGWGYKGVSVLIIAFLVLTVFSFSSYAKEIDDIKAAIKEKGLQWEAEENEISQLPPAERKMRLGILEGEDPAYKAAAPAPLPSPDMTGVVTNWLDWTNYNGYNYVTAVKDQGHCGSCWAFSATAAIESQLLIDKGSYVNLSEQSLLSCNSDPTHNNCGGGYETTAASYLTSTGIPLESCYPYRDYYNYSEGAASSCSYACAGRTGQSYKISGWGSVPANVPAIKSAIATYGPVVARYAVYSDFYSYHSGVYQYGWGSYQGLHAILVVGYYDDAYYGGGGYFKVKNSWGTGWASYGGYFYIAYSQVGSSPVYFGSQVEAYYNGLEPWDGCTSAYEPNDTSLTAYPISTGTVTTKICSPSDWEWFDINVTGAGMVSLGLTVPGTNDYDLALYNPSGHRVGYSYNSMGYSESITWPAGVTGHYKICVYGWHGDYNTVNNYSLNYAFAGISINLSAPNGTAYDGCAYYSPPAFSWSFSGDTTHFKKLEIRFSADSSFLTYVKAPLVLGSTTYTPTAAVWKKIMLLPLDDTVGGTVYWKVVGTMTDNGQVPSNVFPITINAPAAVTGFSLSSHSKSSLPPPTIQWNDNCNKKFKVWFGSASDFTLTTTKKKVLTFNDALPTDNGGVFSQLLTSGQWTAIQSVVGGVAGSHIYYYIEAWDAANRHTQTETPNAVSAEFQLLP
jgi:cathepsin B